MQISLDFLHNGCSNRLHFDVMWLYTSQITK
jgi:hypothetical protein